MQNLENLDNFEILITQKLLKCPKDPFLRSALNYNFTLIKFPYLGLWSLYLVSYCFQNSIYDTAQKADLEMPTLNGALQEYERHFSGIWGHFPECCIFPHKGAKFTHTSFLQDELQYRLIQYLLPPSQIHG